MRINTKYIKSLKPCQDGLDNWMEHYSNFQGSLVQFLNLKNITFEDKKWVTFRSLDDKSLRLMACGFARSVLKNYTKLYKDASIENSINVAERYANGEATKEELAAAESAAESAWSAIYVATWSTGRSAGRSAAWSAIYAADSATHAAESAGRSAIYAAIYAAESAAKSAANAAKSAALITAGVECNYEKTQIAIMKKYANV